MEPLPKRILVFGTSGAGKTTLSKQLSQILQIKHIELDQVHWQPNWAHLPKPEFREKVEDILDSSPEQQWVIDGNYKVLWDILFPRATDIIWLDYPLYIVLWRLIIRTFLRIFYKEEICNGNVETFSSLMKLDPDKNLILYAIDNHPKLRKQYPILFQQENTKHIRTSRFRSPKETEDWLSGLKLAVRSE
jgi:adenylate kinase family enzyme